MSTQRLAILAAVTTHNLMTRNSSDMERHGREHQMHSDQQTPRPPNGTQFHGNVNVLLGGAMLSVVVTMVCFVCYCCHRNLRKRSETVYRQRWLDADANMEIYSVAQCYDLSPESRAIAASIDQYQLQQHQQQQPISLTPSLPISLQGPPPSYETVVAMDQTMDGCDKCLQMHRGCSYANCDQAHSDANAISGNTISELQHHLHHHHHHLPSVHVKMDNEPNNNADETPTAVVDRRIFNVLDVTDARATATNAAAPVAPGRCNCELYATPQQPSLTCCTEDTENFEFIKKCRLCGTEINSNYCDCFAMVRSPMLNQRATDGAAVRATTNNDSSRDVPVSLDNGNVASRQSVDRMPRHPSTCANNNYGYVVSDDDDVGDNGIDDGRHNDNQQGDGGDYHRNVVGAAADVGVDGSNDNNRATVNEANCPCETRRRLFDGQNNNSNNNNNGPVDLDAFNEAGLIRMDMSQIIDQTGLPTYEAALKFESSGYV